MNSDTPRWTVLSKTSVQEGESMQRVSKKSFSRNCISRVLFGSVSLIGLSWGTLGYAQTTPGGIETVVVTAEKRSTDLERTAMAITALNSESLDQHQVRDLRDLRSLVPNFQMGDAQGIAQITVRGIGSSAFLPGTEGAVAVNENEIYVSRNVAQQTGLFDVADIEVLRGPQGTLYGRNATAGAVNISTARPTDELSGYAKLNVGNYGEVRLDGAVGGPVDDDDTLLVRLAGFYERHDGYGTNLATHHDIDDKSAYGLRGTLVFKPDAHFTGTLIAEYYDENDRQGAFHYFGAAGLSGISGSLGFPPLFEVLGGAPPKNIRNIDNGIDPRFDLPTFSATGILDWTDGAFTIRSITGYRDQKPKFTYDLDGGAPLSLFEFEGEPAHQISEELQLHYDTDVLHLTGGAYYFNEHDDSSPAHIVGSTTLATLAFGIPYPTPGYLTIGNLDADFTTEAEAAFAQASYNLTPDLTATAGIRYSVEKKGISSRAGLDLGLGGLPLFPPYPGPNPLGAPYATSKTFHSVTPKLGLQYQVDPTTMLYATYSQGFKSGGFDSGVIDPTAFKPEKLTDYEAGLKTTTLDDHLRLNLAGFYYDYSDLQVTQVVGLNVQTGNAATARDYGVEGELTYLATSALEFDASGAWTHARYRKYVGPDPALPLLPVADFSGNTLDNAPDWQATVAAQYTWQLLSGDLTARGEAEYTSRFYFSPGNERELSQGSFVKGNFYLTYDPDADWTVTAYVKNVANTTTKTSALVGTPLVFNPIEGSLAPPRLFGIEVNRRF
jgi:iron complex outermembrane receptor protein